MSTVTVSVYGRRAQVNPENPSFSFHTGRVLPYIEVFAIVGEEGRKWRESFKVTSHEVARQQIEEVLTFFNDTRNEYEQKRVFYEMYTEDEDVSRYKDDHGMSGWLDPDGVFHWCGFGQHVKYALDLLNKDLDAPFKPAYSDEMEELMENQHISMSNGEQSTGGFISILGQLTPPQVTWFDRFFFKLSPTQRSSVARAAREQGAKLKYEW